MEENIISLSAQYPLDQVETLIELAEDGMLEDVEDDIVAGFPEFEKELEKAKLKTLLSGEYDKDNAIVTLHAGAGGTDSYTNAPLRSNFVIS